MTWGALYMLFIMDPKIMWLLDIQNFYSIYGCIKLILTQIFIFRSNIFTTIRVADGNGQPIVRAIAFDPTGALLGAAWENKTVRIYICSDWTCTWDLKGPKRFTTVSFTPDGAHVLAGDKFGDVLVAAQLHVQAHPEEEGTDKKHNAFEILLGHFCSTLTAVELSRSGKYIATADRDNKVRVTAMPPEPLKGAYDIQSFCLGHTNYVTCVAWVTTSNQEELLVSGGGDGTLRVWDPMSGKLLSVLEIPNPVQNEEDTTASVIVTVVSNERDGSIVAAIEGSDEVLYCSIVPPGNEDGGGGGGRSSHSLVESSRQRVQGMRLPSDIKFDKEGRLWVVGGPLSDTSSRIFVACIDGSGKQMPLPDEMRAALQGGNDDDDVVTAHSGGTGDDEGGHRRYFNLRKRMYSAEEMVVAERKKRNNPQF